MFAVNIQSLLGFNERQEQFARSAIRRFEKAMNTDRLKEMIFGFEGIAGSGFVDNAGLSNQQVYEKLIAGSETYLPEKNFQADLFLVLQEAVVPPLAQYPAIGFGLPGSKEIITYTWWFATASEATYAGHIAHEWSHKVGFSHSFDFTPTRQYSVPYAFGNMIVELAEKM